MILQLLAVSLLHAFPAWTVVRWTPVPQGPWTWTVFGIAAVQTLLLVFGRDIAFMKDGPAARAVYRVSMISFVLILDLFLASAAHLMIRGISFLAAGMFGIAVPPGLWTLIPVFTLALIHVAWGLANARRLSVRRVRFDAPDFPGIWDGRRILFFSDTHYGSLNGTNMAERLVRAIAEEAPDLVICGGDLFDGPGGDVNATLEALSRIEAPLGVLAVLGNHDYYYLSVPGSSRELLNRQRRRDEMPREGSAPLARMKDALPWRFLENETTVVDGIVFAGLRPYSRADEREARKCLAGLDAGLPTVLVNHKPVMVEDAAAAGARLQLSGHTHGGPVFPMNVVMRHVLKGRHYGTSRIGSLVLDVSSGSGISLWYPRTAGRHEVVVIEMSVSAEVGSVDKP